MAKKEKYYNMDKKYFLGLDVGSTTVKGVFQEEEDGELKTHWQRYERHETRQAEKLWEYLVDLEIKFPDLFYTGSDKIAISITGSGGSGLVEPVGAQYFQEVLCVSNAVQTQYPNVSSVIELGGQDAKIIILKRDEKTDRTKKIMTMNDKCAGGTGAVIDKIAGKLNLTPDQLKEIHYDPEKVHPVAGKCGVFAETDINSLQKSGVPPNELMISLFDAIVQQNLSVLTRGNTMAPEVMLLGGPNTFLPGMQEAWRHNLSLLWKEKKMDVASRSIEELIYAPDMGEYFAAMGSILVRREYDIDKVNSTYTGSEHFKAFIDKRRLSIEGPSNLPDRTSEYYDFKNKFVPPEWEAPIFYKGENVIAYLGLDGGSTSTKGILLDPEGELIGAEYLLSKGNPIDDVIEIIKSLRSSIESSGATLEILGVGTTGYAKDLIKEIVGGDVAVVETVAHTLAAKHYYNDIDVIVDVGGQDIKLIHIKNGKVKDFKLNTQCSAGNGYFLQNTAEGFGYKVEDYAQIAFSAKRNPRFGYGCAVFLQTDIVDFQRQGWEAPEIMAGLAEVLPRNIWQYVAQIPNPSILGKRFVLQGGTQKNIAAAKSQVDYLHDKFEGTGITPEVIIHRHTSVCGAIGAALEAARVTKVTNKGNTAFLGLDETETIEYKTTYNESTRCNFCKNKCIRTFIDINTEHETQPRRFIVAPCEKGEVEEKNDLREIRLKSEKIKKENLNLSEVAARVVWEDQTLAATRMQKVFSYKKKLEAEKTNKNRAKTNRNQIKIAIPRTLDLYGLQPFFTAYFQFLGIPFENIIFSDLSTEKLYKDGSRNGIVDPCFPAKLSMAHIYNLLKKWEQTHYNYLFFPMISAYDSGIVNAIDHRACPTANGGPEMAYSAYTKEKDVFAEKNIEFLKPVLFLDSPGIAEKGLFNTFGERFNMNIRENHFAVKAGFHALKKYKSSMERKGLQIIRQVEREKRVAIVMLGRVYHNDEGLNHSILEQFQSRGYPILTTNSLPTDPEFLKELFSYPGDEQYHPMDITDVWKNSYSAASSQKIWAAKFTARHPNLIPLELSSFKCGHDSTLYSAIEKIVETQNTPHFSFKDIDENNPTGSIKIRVETIDYFLKEYTEKLRRKKEETVNTQPVLTVS
ncbi:MAG: BadF/BadG/BcrA/BcrD ATPase family protein [Leptospirales bacterium]